MTDITALNANREEKEKEEEKEEEAAVAAATLDAGFTAATMPPWQWGDAIVRLKAKIKQLRLGGTKTLKELGLPLPDPELPGFDEAVRGIFDAVAKQHPSGLPVFAPTDGKDGEEDGKDEEDEEEDKEEEDGEEDEEDEEEEDETKPAAKKQKRGPPTDMFKVFGGSHAKVLVYYMELGNFVVELDKETDSLLVRPRNTNKKAMRGFRSRFGRHFRALGYNPPSEVDLGVLDDDEVPYALPYAKGRNIDLATLEPVRDREAESMEMLETDPFA